MELQQTPIFTPTPNNFKSRYQNRWRISNFFFYGERDKQILRIFFRLSEYTKLLMLLHNLVQKQSHKF